MKVSYENNGFRAKTTSDWKHIEVDGPGLPHIEIDFDDVNHDEVKLEVTRLVDMRAEHWHFWKPPTTR